MKSVEQALQRKLTVPADRRALEGVRRFVEATLEEAGLDRALRARLEGAIEVAAGAFVEASDDASSSITVSLDVNDVRFKARVVDSRVDFGGGRRRGRPPTLRIRPLQRVLDEIQYGFQRGFEHRLEMLKFL